MFLARLLPGVTEALLPFDPPRCPYPGNMNSCFEPAEDQNCEQRFHRFICHVSTRRMMCNTENLAQGRAPNLILVNCSTVVR